MHMFSAAFPATSLGGMDRLIHIFQERTEKRVRVSNGGKNEKTIR